MVEGESHPYYVDSSPKTYIKDVNGNGIIEVDVDSDEDGDVDDDDKDQAILVCGERKGGTSYFALDVTDPFAPVFLWRINQYEDTAALSLPLAAHPDGIIPELGESWSVPRFGLVKTSNGDDTGTPVFFIGGGYSSDNSTGKAVIAINVFDGTVEKKFSGITGMNYCIPSSVTLVDGDSNGFVDKVYVGDLGGQMWRIGKFTDSQGMDLEFPYTDENIKNWTNQAAHILFLSDLAHNRKFFYPPSVTLEWGYDLIFMGTGDREDPCNPNSLDRIYSVKDTHTATTIKESDLIDVTESTTMVPDINIHQGWYIRLQAGEKVLSEGLVFLKTYYVTTFLPGQGGKLYALNYKTGEGVDGSLRVIGVADGLLSKPVVVINKINQKILVSASRISPDGGGSESAGPGILAIEPSTPPANFFYLWWREL
jgi:type IV pilus assembly protein PilY1